MRGASFNKVSVVIKVKFFIVVYCSLALSSSLFAASSEDAPLAQCMSALAEREGFHGVALAGKIGEMPVVKAFSAPDMPGGAPVRATRMNIGSMGKMFTAVAIAQLVDRGALEFDDSIREHMPDLPPDYDAVTIHHLLSHTSGMGNYFSPGNMPTLKNAKSASDLLPLLIAEPLQYSPGEKFQYSNSGFALLGVLIERITGDVYADHIKISIFDVAGMTATGLDPDAKTTAAGYTRMSRERMADRRPGAQLAEEAPLRKSSMAGLRGMPAGGGYSTVEDLFLFASALLANRLTAPDTTAVLLSPKPKAQMQTRNGDTVYYGYGFFIGEEGDRVGHGGGGPGVNGELRIRRESGWVFTALTNLDPPMATLYASALEKTIVGGESAGGCAAFQ